MSVKGQVVTVMVKGRYELSSDFSLIENRFAGDGEAFDVFKEAMEGRSYGLDALSTAWSWFWDGWNRGREFPADEISS